MTTITLEIQDSKLLPALKTLFSTMKGVSITEETEYDQEFVKQIQESREQIKAGKCKKIKTEDLWK